ncbi:MAG: OmpA family protein [Polyangiaceae bacterium]|nr:OmpA family protein [Polyangiaceae bacterium]
MKHVCPGVLVAFVMVACEPPAKVTTPAAAPGVSAEVAAKPLPTASAVAAVEPAPLASAPSAAAPVPCPPEAPAPAGALAWVNGCKIELGEKIYFDFDKATIRPQSFPVLDAVGDILFRDVDLHVEIQGHLGDPDREAYGRKLSQHRAQAVMNYLIAKKGIARERLTAVGYENSVPIADWRTEEGRAKNRRIELVIRKWSGGENR